jgi:regulator of protease activity HflC (stomatin/prohibitin superfamily)
LLLTTILMLASLRTVPAGNLGMVVTFGHVDERPLTPGMHLTNPSARIVPFSVKTMLFEQHNTVPTQEGLLVGLDVALLFHIKRESVYEIYTTVGDNYEDVVISPLLASEVRGLTSQSEAKALYGVGRELIQSNLTTIMTDALAPRGIVVEKVLLRAIKLPELLRSSIEAKAQAEQAAEQMKFVLQKEQQEAERKTIEATGIADFQRIVSEGITPSLLQWKGIEATEKFSGSQNSKLVIMGNTQASLPVMLSGDTAKSEM